MTAALTLLGIAVVVLLTRGLAQRVGVLSPLLLIAVGVAGSFLSFVPEISITPDIVLLGLLPPLLYATAIRTSLLDMKANKSAILSLSVGLVLFTTVAVGVVVHWLLPISLPLAIAIGAVVAPPDAVAATAVARSIGLPRTIVTILEGESLLNDATALVSLRTAIAAAGLATAHAGPVSAGSVALDFARAVIGGVLIGWVVYAVVARVRPRITDPVADTALSFVVPFAAFLPAEKVHVSGVLAVVVAGLLLGHRAPVLQHASSRLSERWTWLSVQFLLENAVFLLIGLQAASIIRGVDEGEVSLGRALVVSLVVLLVVLAVRPVWVFPFRWLRLRLSRSREHFDWRQALVSSWAGMRGVVTLAAVLTIPETAPYRPTLVLIALVVTIGTLAVQGLTLPGLARALGVRGPDPREDALQEATVVQAAVTAGLRSLDGDDTIDAATREVLHERAQDRVNRVWERLGRGETRTPSEAHRHARMISLTAERAEILRIRDEGAVDTEVLDSVLAALDVEESALAWRERRNEALRDDPIGAPAQVAGACEHLRESGDCALPTSSEGCEGCLAEGLTDWVHLRLCLQCGHVGCCDSSPRTHASTHFHASGHPVMRSLEPGEVWRWCFVDETLG